MEIGSLGVPELLIILVVVLLLFGPRRLPEVARGLGQAVRGFREGLRSELEENEASTESTEAIEARAARLADAETEAAPDRTTSELSAPGSKGGGEPPVKAA